MPTEKQIANRQAWLAALRSGEYRQERDTLIVLDGPPSYCCLGVAMEISEECSRHKDDHSFSVYGYWYSIMPPGNWFGNEYGLSSDWAESIMSAGAKWNDHDRLDFSAIADGLEWSFALADNYPRFPGLTE